MRRSFNHSFNRFREAFAMKGSMMDYPLSLQAILERIPKSYPTVEILSLIHI